MTGFPLFLGLGQPSTQLPSQGRPIQTRTVVVEVLPAARTHRTIQPTPPRNPQGTDILAIAGIRRRDTSVVLATCLWSIIGTELEGGAVLGVEASHAAGLLGGLGGLD